MPAVQAISPDSIRQAVREVFARPEYAWAPTARPLYWIRDLWLRFVEWLGRFTAHHPVGAKVLFWGALLVLFALLVHLGTIVWRIYRVTVERPGATRPGVLAAALDARGHLAHAEALARGGRYAEALAHRFRALVLELDHLEALTFHPSKTPAEYAHEARLGLTARASLADLVARLYRHIFGAEPCDEAAYRDFGAAAGALVQHAAPH